MSEPGEARIDLHCHTVVSDGTLTPTQLVELAARKGLAAIAITDHDHMGALPEARAAGSRLGVEVIAGIELSTEWPGEKGDIHLLGYLLDERDAALSEHLARFRDVRERRGALIVQKLQALGIAITFEDVERAAGPGAGSIGRPHVARALMDKGIVSSVKEAFDRWLGDDGPAFVAKEKLDARDAIALVRAAGGVSVLAHPGLLPAASRMRILRALAAAGLDGVEVEYPRHTSQERKELAAVTQELGLVATGGSDFHGENKPDIDLGYGIGANVRVTMRTLDALRARADRPRRSPTSRGS